jgi:hypothetical protein
VADFLWFGDFVGIFLIADWGFRIADWGAKRQEKARELQPWISADGRG